MSKIDEILGELIGAPDIYYEQLVRNTKVKTNLLKAIEGVKPEKPLIKSVHADNEPAINYNQGVNDFMKAIKEGLEISDE